jgi:antitoxin VapB
MSAFLVGLLQLKTDGGISLEWHHSTMALNIKDKETEELAAEVAAMAGESKTGAVRQALRERRDRLNRQTGDKKRDPGSFLRFLETEIWPQIPEEMRGQPPMTKEEVEEILGYGPEGY